MGNRANYILKRGSGLDIFYSHWRAINIAQDLMLGERKFTTLVQQFSKANELLNEPWMEACVLLDFDQKRLTFWETEVLFETSIREEYLNQLKSIWTGWTIKFAYNEMFDIENELSIQYTAKQKIDLEYGSLEKLSDFSNDEDYFSCLIIIKESGKHSVKYVNGGHEEEIALIGELVIDKLKLMENRKLKREGNDDFFGLLIIDIDKKNLWVNMSINGLKHQLRFLWKNWNINTGNFGYIKLLREIGIDTMELELSPENVKKSITKIANGNDNFNPNDLAEKLIGKMGENIQFNEHFFENVNPKKLFKKE